MGSSGTCRGCGADLKRCDCADKQAEIDRLNGVLDEVNERLAVLEPKVGSLVDELEARRAEAVRLHGALNGYPHADTCGTMLEPSESYPCSCWRSELGEFEAVLDPSGVPPREIPTSPDAALAAIAPTCLGCGGATKKFGEFVTREWECAAAKPCGAFSLLVRANEKPVPWVHDGEMRPCTETVEVRAAETCMYGDSEVELDCEGVADHDGPHFVLDLDGYTVTFTKEGSDAG